MYGVIKAPALGFDGKKKFDELQTKLFAFIIEAAGGVATDGMPGRSNPWNMLSVVWFITNK